MDGLNGSRAPISRRAALKQAVEISSLVIATCEDLLLARRAPEEELLSEFDAHARELRESLASAEQPLSMELEFFKDFTINNADGGISAFTFLGLPVCHIPNEGCHIDSGLAVVWLRIYRKFHWELQAVSQDTSRCRRRGAARGGRPKDPEVLQLENEVQRVLDESLRHYIRNGADRKDAIEAMSRWTQGDVVRRINEELGRNYPVRGPGSDAFRKRVDRSPAFMRLKQWSADRDESTEEPPRAPRRDEHWARENGLFIPR